MIEIFMFLLMLGGIVSITLSVSKKNFRRLVEGNDITFAQQTTKKLKKLGCISLALSVSYFVFIYLRYR